MAATFEQFDREHRGALLRFATALTADRMLAEDVVQDVMVKVLSRWEFVGSRDHPLAYVRRMVVNEYLSWRRKWARIVPRSELPADVSVADATGTSDDRVALVEEIRRLPPKQRAVIMLRYFEDLPDADIAAILGCSQSAVRVNAHRALATLRVDATTQLHPSGKDRR